MGALRSVWLGVALSVAACGDGKQGRGIHVDPPGTQPPGGDPPGAGNTPRPPGALVEVTMASTVGVVLDDLPASVRDRVAADYLQRPAASWIERAKRQVGFTWLRLAARSRYYEDDKASLQLTRSERWNITLTGPVQRTVYQGHDAVVVSYQLSTTLLTDPASLRVSEPALATVGGTWDEPFQLPLDPELVFQRTGYACVDEDGEPPNTPDGENVWRFYDQTCDVERVDRRCHFTEPAPEEDCVDALERRIGRVDTQLRFVRAPWNAQRADEVRLEGWTQTRAPDVVPLAEGLEDHRVVYRYIHPSSCAIAEGCVEGSGWRRLLQYTAGVLNRGQQPLRAGTTASGSPYRTQNLFEYSACHQHYHFAHYARFDFASFPGKKRAFCLESTQRYFNDERTTMTQPFSCSNQGIQPGWRDDYVAGIECQWIDITADAPQAMTQPLSFRMNPDALLCEGTPVTDGEGEPLFDPTPFVSERGDPIGRPRCTVQPGAHDNNFASVDVTIRASGGFVTDACRRDQTGPLRDCGFREEPVRGCSPGARVTLSCAPAEQGAPLQVVRVCEASTKLGVGTACTFRDALANVVVEGTKSLTFTCPTARDSEERGGKYALYLAPVVHGDAPAAVSCE